MGSPERLSCKAASEDVISAQIDKIVKALTAQSAGLVTIMAKLEDLASSLKGTHMVNQYQQVVAPARVYGEVVGQLQQPPGKAPIER